MRKNTFLLVIFLVLLGSANVYAAVSKLQVKSHIQSLYKDFQFNRYNKISMEAFSAGVTGYYNLLEEGKISKNILTICDFTQSSKNKRMWILDMKNKKVLLHTYVAHGKGSGDEFVRRLSNVHESHTSSQGFYKTGSIYNGNNGRSIKLHGLDGRYNSNAYSRAIVLHGADYVSERFIKAYGRLGRSYGCPAVERRLTNTVINYIVGQSAFFIYSPANGYLSRSHWINSPIGSIPNLSNAATTTSSTKTTDETQTIAKYVAKNLDDSLSNGLVKPNTNIGDGKTYIGRSKITKEQADRMQQEERIKRLLRAKSMNGKVSR